MFVYQRESLFGKISIFLCLFKHPNEIANMSLALLQGKQQVRVPRTAAKLQLRIGIHTGIYLTHTSIIIITYFS